MVTEDTFPLTHPLQRGKCILWLRVEDFWFVIFSSEWLWTVPRKDKSCLVGGKPGFVTLSFLSLSKVYGTLFHMKQGNPFKLKDLVDKWPDFSTVIICPQDQEMSDDLDHYTNTYLIFTQDLKKCQEFLGIPEVINWKHHLQIQSSQSSLDKVIENLVADNLGKVKHTQCILYMRFGTVMKLVPWLGETSHSSISNQSRSIRRCLNSLHWMLPMLPW
ncbi:glycine N-acyltransferase-like protein Keg1 [Dipodomys merriami]|uniref:glycine N-acyltransferase-like protein Keg1 n=1 Tax=Dipodomys merriami TaxID=94247 RepID=UPI003855D9D0